MLSNCMADQAGHIAGEYAHVARPSHVTAAPLPLRNERSQILMYVRSKSRSHVSPSSRISQAPVIVLPSGLKVPV